MNWDIRGNKIIIVQRTGNKRFESFLGDDRFEVFMLGPKKKHQENRFKPQIEDSGGDPGVVCSFLQADVLADQERCLSQSKRFVSNCKKNECTQRIRKK